MGLKSCMGKMCQRVEIALVNVHYFWHVWVGILKRCFGRKICLEQFWLTIFCSIHNILDSKRSRIGFISMLNLFTWKNLENWISQEFDYAHHPKPGFSNCFFTWVCGNGSYATMKNVLIKTIVFAYLIVEITFHSLLKCVPGILISFKSTNDTFITYIAKCSIYFCSD
jgi:hypothetical protein